MLGGVGVEGAAEGVGDQQEISREGEKNGEGRRGCNIHQPVTATLLGGLDDELAEAVELALAGVDDGALGQERDKGVDSELGELADELINTRALGHGDGERERGHGTGRVAKGGEFDAGVSALAEEITAGGETLAVEDLDGLAWAQAQDPQGVAGLVLVEPDGFRGRDR